MNPTSIALPNKLSKPNLPRLLHLLDEFEQAAMVGSVTSNDICCTTQHVVAVLHTPDERIELLAAVARGHHDGLSPRFADGVEELVYEYVQQMICTLRWAVVDALAQRRGTGAQFGYGKIGGLPLTPPEEGRCRPRGSV